MSVKTIISPKKLIEVALPLDAINEACSKEKSIRDGHPSSLHLWWARRPLAAARAVIFSQFVNDPASLWEAQNPGKIPGTQQKGAFTKRRQELFKLIEELVTWDNTSNKALMEKVNDEIKRSWVDVCELNKNHESASRLFNPSSLPSLHDPFAGGGAIPIEAKRLGLNSNASDLNPVAVLINKAMIEIPTKFEGLPPVMPPQANKTGKGELMLSHDFSGNTGIADDVQFYGDELLKQVKGKIGEHYPLIEISKELADGRQDLSTHVGKKMVVIAWLWARTVESPDPAFSGLHVPLVGSFVIATKNNEPVWVEPVINRKGKQSYKFAMRIGGEPSIKGTITDNGAKCILSDAAMSFSYIRNEAKEGRMGTRLMGIVAKSGSEKIYLSPTEFHELKASDFATPECPAGDIPDQALGIRVQLYGLKRYGDLFSKRQALMMSTISDCICNFKIDGCPEGRLAAIKTYLALSMGRYADYGSSMTFWDARGPSIQKTFGLPTLQMRWSYPETNPFADFSGSYQKLLDGVVESIRKLPPGVGQVKQTDAVANGCIPDAVISTDPPYYDNIGYASLSDYFYIWLRKSLREIYPELLATILTPKEPELIAEPGRHGSKDAAAKFFEDGFAGFASRINERSHPAFPTTIYYAFKQAEVEKQGGDTVSTGWELFLAGLVTKGWQIVGTWPLRTEQKGGLRTAGRNSLASSIVLVCRKRDPNSPTTSRRDFVRELNRVLPIALDEMTKGAGKEQSPVAPVDLSQAIIGPGMAVFSKYTAVLEADGTHMSVRTALQLVNRYLAEDDFDADTQFCLNWFEQNGWKDGPYGDAETLATGKGTSVGGVKDAGVIQSGGGKVRLYKWSEYPADWNPLTDNRTPIWEALHHLIRALKRDGGETASGALLASLGGKAEAVRQLAYRLYTLCERLGQAEDARAYNELITGWTAIETAAAAAPKQASPRLPGFENT